MGDSLLLIYTGSHSRSNRLNFCILRLDCKKKMRINYYYYYYYYYYYAMDSSVSPLMRHLLTWLVVSMAVKLFQSMYFYTGIGGASPGSSVPLPHSMRRDALPNELCGLGLDLVDFYTVVNNIIQTI